MSMLDFAIRATYLPHAEKSAQDMIVFTELQSIHHYIHISVMKMVQPNMIKVPIFKKDIT